MSAELVLDVCLAVRERCAQAADEGFKKILAQEDVAAFFKAAADCMLFAYRKQQYELAAKWLNLAKQRLLMLLASPEYCVQAADFLQRLAFVVCDRRLADVRPVLELLVLRFMRCHRQSSVFNDFWHELLSLAARMARRGWRAETRFLLRLLLRDLLMQRQEKIIFSRLMQLQLHFVAYARWDGFAAACSAYIELMYLYLLFVRRAEKNCFSEIQQQKFLQLAMRSLRDIIANVSRSAMQDDMDIFRQLYQFFWQLAGENKQYKQKLQLLLQLAISYWQNTRPKTSRKQMRFLEDLLQPNLITEQYAKLLKQIC